MFVSLMGDIWNKYNDRITTTGIRYRMDNGTAKPLPCFTVHEFSAFKTRDHYYQNVCLELSICRI